MLYNRSVFLPDLTGVEMCEWPRSGQSDKFSLGARLRKDASSFYHVRDPNVNDVIENSFSSL